MATKSNSMFKINQIAKDLGVKPKELTNELESLGISIKSNSATLETDEVNLLFGQLTAKASIKDIDGYMKGKTGITLPESPEKRAAREEAEAKAKAEAEARAKAEAEAKAKAEAEATVEEPAESAEPTPAVEEKGFKLTNAKNAKEILPQIATRRKRKLLYTPKDVLVETSCPIDVEGKKNDEGIKVKNIIDAEIKEGLKLGYLDKYDGLKMSELKEEYENDTVYEIADQEFKKMGLLLDGDKVKVYVFDWTGDALHHVGYLPKEQADIVTPYLKDMEKYSFDLSGIITGGKSKTITKDAKTGKITVTKGKDGNYGIDLDITILNRKD